MSTSTAAFSPSRRRAYRMLVLTELRLAWRTPIYLVVALGIPVLLLIIFGSIPSLTQPNKEFGGVSFFTIYTPTLMVLVLIVLGLLSLPSQMASYREQGVLHRMSTTPVPASALLGAQVAVNIIFAVVSIAMLLGVGAGAFNLVLPLQFGWFVLSLALTVAAMFGIGLCIAAFASSARIAQRHRRGFSSTRWPSSRGCTARSACTPAWSARSQSGRPPGAAFNALHASLGGTLPRLDGARGARRLRSCVQRDRRPLVPLGRRAIPPCQGGPTVLLHQAERERVPPADRRTWVLLRSGGNTATPRPCTTPPPDVPPPLPTSGTGSGRVGRGSFD